MTPRGESLPQGPPHIAAPENADLHGGSEADLVGRHVLAVVNFPPKQIANFVSEVLVLGAVQPDKEVILLRPDREAALGARVA